MPRTASTGAFAAAASSFNPAVADTVIDEGDWNSLLADIETALSTETATTRALWVLASQVQDGAITHLTSVAGADTITAVAPLSMTAYVTGQKFSFVSAGANTTTVTLNLNSIGAKAITKRGTTGLAAGDIQSGEMVYVMYDGTQFQIVGPPTATNIARSARTSNTILAAADKGTLVEITSGTFSQTFTASATLGSGWWVIIYQSGTGEVTLEPNASEQIDGLTNYIMYPGEARLITCTGTAFETVLLKPFNYTYTGSGTFTTPPGYRYFAGLLWGAGGSGGKNNGNVGGGGGGACLPFQIPASSFGTTETITIGAGGGTQTGAGADGTVGGNSSIGSLATAYGGGPGNGASGLAGAGGGGVFSVGTTAGVGGLPNYTGSGLGGDNPGFGGASGGRYDAVANGGYGVYGGGGGGSNDVGGPSLYGGGGGGGCGAGGARAGGASTFGGAGGASVAAGSGGTAGSAPGGGGGATQTGTGSGAGARGELRIWGL